MPSNPLLKHKQKKGTGNNARGTNGSNNGTWPEEHVLKASLLDYARRQLSLKKRKQALFDDHGLNISVPTLKKLNAHFEVPNTRNRALSFEEAQEKILEKMRDDERRNRGPNTTKMLLALEGSLAPRRVVRYIMRSADPGGASHRYPGRKTPIPRGQLRAQGTWEQDHGDGHEKLGKAALRMGDNVSFNIYGYRDQWSGAAKLMRVIPDDRKADAIGHLFLDYVDEYSAMAQQTILDGGSEIGVMKRFATTIKTVCAPDIDQTVYPAVVQVKSVHNTPIESWWHWFQQHVGQNLFDRITYGRDQGIFHSFNALHVNLVNWIWPPVIQGELNRFCEMWNVHVPRKQKDKVMPSGVAPLELFMHPEQYGGERFSIPVPPTLTAELRKDIKMPYDEAFAFVSPQFDEWAHFIYQKLRAPAIDAQNAWDIFILMAGEMQAQMNEESNG